MSLKSVLPASIAESFPSAWASSEDAVQAPMRQDARVKETMRVLQEYLLNESAPVLSTEGKYLTSDLIDEETIRFTHIPYEADASQNAIAPSAVVVERAVFDRTIQQLHTVLPFDQIAQLPLFAGYLTTSQTILGETARL